ncbi:MAG TPA: hypothetical protein VGP02_08725 [Mycobacteriales bacterium]|nr:hypothetical protein [Mycobacteriales bacterium]
MFLARLGVLGAVAAAGGLLPATESAAARPIPGVDVLRPILAELARDTMNGLAVFVVPGPDAYSRAQGTPRGEPGAMEARTPDFLLEALDTYVPFPDEIARPVATAFATGLAGTALDLPAVDTGPLDDALTTLLRNDETIPLSLAIALALNLVATQVDPASLRGPFLSPFARLSFARKAEVFRLIEGPDSDLVALLDTELPQPLKESVSGLLKFVGGALLEFAMFGSYTEWAVFEPRTKTLRARPVGWQLTAYRGVRDGSADFHGYYQGRTKVSDR